MRCEVWWKGCDTEERSEGKKAVASIKEGRREERKKRPGGGGLVKET